MIELKLKTNNEKLALNFSIQFKGPIVLRAIGVDAFNRKNTFFNRLIEPNGKYFDVDFTLPISPKELLIKFINETNGDKNLFKINSIEVDYLKNNGVDLTAYDYKNIQWLKKFCSQASYLPNGQYYQTDGGVWINYMNQIVEGDMVLNTPARVDHETGEIQINAQQFREFTIPIRMVILCHEYSHWIHNNRDETFCDLEALRICLGLGFPKTECIYTFTNILNESKQNEIRMKKIVNYIENYGRF